MTNQANPRRADETILDYCCSLATDGKIREAHAYLEECFERSELTTYQFRIVEANLEAAEA